MKVAIAVVVGLALFGLVYGECDEAKVEKAYEACLEKHADPNKVKEVEKKCEAKAKKACDGTLTKGLTDAFGMVNKMFEGLAGKGGGDLGKKLEEMLGSGDIMKKISAMFGKKA